jgi:hypothetical protein
MNHIFQWTLFHPKFSWVYFHSNKTTSKGEMKTKREHPRRSHKSKTQKGSPRGKVHYVSEPHCLGHQGGKRTNYVPEPPCLRHKGAKQQIMFQSPHVTTLLVTWQFTILSCRLDKVNITPCQCGLGEHLLGTFGGLHLECNGTRQGAHRDCSALYSRFKPVLRGQM